MDFEQLVSEARGLPVASATAAAEFREVRHALMAFVDDRLRSRSDLAELIGPDNLSSMQDNHVHHMLLMCSVLSIGRYEILARVLPWVYRTYHAHGFSYSYFEVELSAWREALRTFLSAKAAAEVLLIYEWMMSSHGAVIAIVEHQQQEDRSALWAADRQLDECLHPLIMRDYEGLLKVVAERVGGAEDLAEFYEGSLWPVMRRIGLMWENGLISVAQEHEATEMVTRMMVRLRDSIEFPSPHRGVIVISAAPGEHHVIGSRMLSDLLELDGWRTAFLGANMPAEDLVQLAVKVRAAAVAVSVAMPFCVESAMKVMEKLGHCAQLSATRTMIGGAAFELIPEISELFSADVVGGSATRAVELARQW